jgi:DNA polymerase III delta prime subunit
MEETPLFINKYKPQSIDDFCTDDNLKQVLKTLLKIEDLNILIIGVACSGKTTILNALIREYYGTPPHKSPPHNNILYINNLKEHGIGFFRNEMKTFSQSHSAIHGKKKMIVIDDIDTINEQSQHVFRNYIDKYKKNIQFLSVCTNIQKVIESIQSRVHIIHISPPTQPQLHKLMEKILKEEKMYLNPICKEYILKYSNHSIRTMMNFMEKIYIITKGGTEKADADADNTDDTSVSIETCKNICADIKIHIFEDYIQHLSEGRLTDAIQLIYEIYDYGFSVIDILELFFGFVKTTDIINEHHKYEITRMLCKYITIFYTVHEDAIELTLFTNKLYSLFVGEIADDAHPYL